jgi:hypothetical protein
MLFTTKEEPNEPSIQVWPEESRVLVDGERDMLRRKRRAQKSRENKGNTETETLSHIPLWLRIYEPQIFFIISWSGWVYLVRWLFFCLRFPVHRHYYFVWLVYLMPGLVLYFIFGAIEKWVSSALTPTSPSKAITKVD